MAPKYSSKLAGARVLVLGGSSGIGYAVAEAAVEFGALVHVASSKQERVSSAVAKLKAEYPEAADRVTGSVCDLVDSAAQEANLKALLTEATAQGKLDHVVFTAGNPVPFATLDKVDSSSFDMIGSVRFYGAVRLAQLASQFLNPGPKSSITLTGGALGSKPIPMLGSLIPAYSAAVEGLTRGLAAELKPIRVNAVAPGAVVNETINNLPPQIRDATYEGFRSGTLTGTVGQPEEVAEAYLYAMKDSFLTGSTINTNGGSLIA